MKFTRWMLVALCMLGLLVPMGHAQDGGGEPAPAGDAEAAAEIAALAKLAAEARPIIEQARGLEFEKLPPVAPVTEDEYVEKWMEDLEIVLGGEARVEGMGRLLGRLGVIPADASLRGLLEKFLTGNIAAVYDPRAKRVSFLPRANRTVGLMVHELTHALDDQHFDMNARVAAFDGRFDRAIAYGALAEGDAQSIEQRFMMGPGLAQQPLDQLRMMGEMVANGILAGKYGQTPPGIAYAFKSQYLDGFIFVEHLRRSPRGEDAVNGAFKDPPNSMEQVLHPDKYAAGEMPVEVDLPAPGEGAEVVVWTVLGELGARVVLYAGGLPKPDADLAAAGWGGDRVELVSFGEGAEAVVWVTFWDTADDAMLFQAALENAFPVTTGEASADRTRMIVRRGKSVQYVEAPLDHLPACIARAKSAEFKVTDPTPRKDVLPVE